jgi:hypothetical protein
VQGNPPPIAKSPKNMGFGAVLEKRGHAPSRIGWHFSIAGGEQGSLEADLIASR